MSGRSLSRSVLVVCLLAGLGHWVLFPQANPEQIGIATDVYHHATVSLLDGGSLYGVEPPDHPGFTFLYPPIIGLAAVPFGLAGSEMGAYLLGWAINIVVGLGLGQVFLTTIRHAGISLTRVDRLLLRLVPFGVVPAITTLVLGQANLLLTLGIGGAALAYEGDHPRRAGFVAGVVSLIKLFPALIGIWLLRLRSWRAVLAAIATGVGGLVGGVLILGSGPLDTWWTSVIAGELSVGAFPAGPTAASPYVGLRRQLIAIAPGLPRSWLLPVGLAVMTPALVASYRTVDAFKDRLIALEATVLVSLLVLPLEPFYAAVVLFPTIPLLYLVENPVSRRLLGVGVVLVFVPISWGTVQMALGAPAAPGQLTDALRGIFAVVRPSDIGSWALLGACVWDQHHSICHR